MMEMIECSECGGKDLILVDWDSMEYKCVKCDCHFIYNKETKETFLVNRSQAGEVDGDRPK